MDRLIIIVSNILLFVIAVANLSVLFIGLTRYYDLGIFRISDSFVIIILAVTYLIIRAIILLQ